MRAMTVVAREGTVLKDALNLMDMCAISGAVTPDVVVSVIDNICADMGLAVHQLPEDLQSLRSDAQARRINDNINYREDAVADKIVMCGLWPV
jgi:ATP-dependent Clp protease ATP-binding subunit ClpA